MCLLALALGVHADFPLVIAANRDEQWARPTLPLQAWRLPSGKTLYSGRDQEAGGTWLGFSEDGRVALLTNVRSGSLAPGERSRGELVTHWLADEVTGTPGWPLGTPSPTVASTSSRATPSAANGPG